MKCYLILPNTNVFPDFEQDAIYVGVDRGSLEAINNGYILDYALGDFDSVTPDEYDLIKENTKKILELPRDKDETDTAYAVKRFKNYEIVAYGGLAGKRVEHLLANINLCLEHDNLTFIDDNSYISTIKPEMTFYDDEYKFCSFFAKPNSTISLSGFKFNLKNYTFKEYDSLCISNEFRHDDEEATVKFSGKGVYILTKNDN